MNPLLMVLMLGAGLWAVRHIALVMTVIFIGYGTVMLGVWVHDVCSRAVRKVASWR